jgi:hypothetical protein
MVEGAAGDVVDSVGAVKVDVDGAACSSVPPRKVASGERSGEEGRCGNKREERRELHRRLWRWWCRRGKRKSCAHGHDATHTRRLPVPRFPPRNLFGPQIPNTKY